MLIPVILISSSAILPFFLLSHEGGRPSSASAEEGGRERARFGRCLTEPSLTFSGDLHSKDGRRTGEKKKKHREVTSDRARKATRRAGERVSE